MTPSRHARFRISAAQIDHFCAPYRWSQIPALMA
jgi:hypothetical protein